MTSDAPMPVPFEVQQRVQDGRRELLISGELDMVSAKTLEGALAQLRSEDTRGIALDLSRVSFMDSTGLRAVLAAQRLSEEQGYDFSLTPGPPAVQRLFELTGLLDSLPFGH